MNGEQISIEQALSELGRVIPSRETDPGTSHAAAAEIKVRANSQRAYLLQAFAWADDATDEEAATWHHAVSPFSEYAKRCSELREGGYIEPTGETRPGSAGPQRIVSRITPKGIEWIRANQ